MSHFFQILNIFSVKCIYSKNKCKIKSKFYILFWELCKSYTSIFVLKKKINNKPQKVRNSVQLAAAQLVNLGKQSTKKNVCVQPTSIARRKTNVDLLMDEKNTSRSPIKLGKNTKYIEWKKKTKRHLSTNKNVNKPIGKKILITLTQFYT